MDPDSGPDKSSSLSSDSARAADSERGSVEGEFVCSHLMQRLRRRRGKGAVSVQDLRHKGDHVGGSDEEDDGVNVAALLKDRLLLGPRRRRWRWKLLDRLHEAGLPQEVALSEYLARREKNEEKFLEEFPSIGWQERRVETLEEDRRAAAHKAQKRQNKVRKKLQERQDASLRTHARMSKYRAEHTLELEREDRAMIAKMAHDKVKLQRLEQEENVRHTARVRREAEHARKEAARRAAEDAEAARSAEAERLRLAQEAADAEAALQARVERIMTSSGTKAPESKRQRPVERASDCLAVRFEPELDENDGVLMCFNLLPLSQYVKRFPRAKDHAKVFPAFFAATSTVLAAKNLGAAGARALGRALQVRCCPRLRDLRLSWNNIEFRGCAALAKALAAGACPHLESLALAGNSLGDESAEVLCKAICDDKRLPRLAAVDLSSNLLRANGAHSVSHLLLAPKCPKALASVRLCCNRISDAGAMALHQALRVRPELCVKMRHNHVSERCLAELANRSSTLTF